LISAAVILVGITASHYTLRNKVNLIQKDVEYVRRDLDKLANSEKEK
jgi:hypothetical protein